jgi:plastocyanin
VRRLLVIAGVAAAALPASAAGHFGHPPVEATVGNGAFTPADLFVVEGDIVQWRWTGPDSDHTITGTTLGERWDSDFGRPASQVTHPTTDTYAQQFSTPGTYLYFDRVHPELHGQIVVGPDDDAHAVAGDERAPYVGRLRLSLTRVCPRLTRSCQTRPPRLLFYASERGSLVGSLRRVFGNRATGPIVRQAIVPAARGSNNAALHVANLAPGLYELQAVPYDSAGNHAVPQRRRFVVRMP